jgi:hypothetical protein
MRCVLIDAEKPIYPVAWMCRMLGVPRSSFYAWRHQADTATATRRRLVAQRVAQVFADSRGTYGCRRVAAELNRRGDPASVGLVADLMCELGLRACQPRSYEEPAPVKAAGSSRASVAGTSGGLKPAIIWPANRAYMQVGSSTAPTEMGQDTASPGTPLRAQHCPKCPCRQTRFRAEIMSLASVVDRHCSPRSTVVCAAVWQSPSGR